MRVLGLCITAIVGVGLALSGCASYSVGYADRVLPGGYTLISVPVFKNLTAQTGTEVFFTDAIIRELERSDVVRVGDKSSSQTTLEGVIESIQLVPTAQEPVSPESAKVGGGFVNAAGPIALNTQYVVRTKVRLTLKRNSDQQVLWSNLFESEKSYYAPRIGTPGLNSANALYNHSARYQILSGLAVDMMAEAHDRLMENTW